METQATIEVWPAILVLLGAAASGVAALGQWKKGTRAAEASLAVLLGVSLVCVATTAVPRGEGPVRFSGMVAVAMPDERVFFVDRLAVSVRDFWYCMLELGCSDQDAGGARCNLTAPGGGPSR